MSPDQRLTNLEQLLDRLEDAARNEDRVAISSMIAAVGRRSFGPLLLVAGLIALSPLSGIPGIPTVVAIIVVLIAGQLLFGRSHFWLPRWLMRRTVPRSTFVAAMRMLRPLSRFTDRFLRPRLRVLTHAAGVYVIAVICVVIAVPMPVMEIVPLSATCAGAALTAFGLALIAEDGLVALIALLLTAATAVLVIKSVL